MKKNDLRKDHVPSKPTHKLLRSTSGKKICSLSLLCIIRIMAKPDRKINRREEREIGRKKKGVKGQGGEGKITKPRQETRGGARMERIRESQDALRSAFGLIFRGHKT